MDRYRNFEELEKSENGNYRITSIGKGSPMTIAAIHGGNIDLGTGDIAVELSGEYNLYLFEGLRSDSRELHITSNNYREDSLEVLLEVSEACVSIHGMKGEEEAVYVSSSNKKLEERMRESLSAKGFTVRDDDPMDRENFVNLAKDGGVQLELTRGLRDRMFKGGALKTGKRAKTFYEFCDAVREGIREYLQDS